MKILLLLLFLATHLNLRAEEARQDKSAVSSIEEGFTIASAESKVLGTNYVSELTWAKLKERPWDGDSPLPLSPKRAVEIAESELISEIALKDLPPGLPPWKPVSIVLHRWLMLDYWYYQIELVPWVKNSYNNPKVTIFVSLAGGPTRLTRLK